MLVKLGLSLLALAVLMGGLQRATQNAPGWVTILAVLAFLCVAELLREWTFLVSGIFVKRKSRDL